MTECFLSSVDAVAGILERVHSAIPVLLDAYVAGRDVGAGSWDFAVEIRELRREGATLSDLRWMVCKGLIMHAEECGVLKRRFRRQGQLSFSEQSCFILTAKGKRWFEEHRQAKSGNCPDEQPCAMPAVSSPKEFQGNGAHHDRSELPMPHWDADGRRLYLGERMVKQFRGPATNQIRIITAFQELAWPGRIDDPLPPVGDLEPKKRLHDAIQAFNRNQKNCLLRFKGDGTGIGIVWERVDRS